MTFARFATGAISLAIPAMAPAMKLVAEAMQDKQHAEDVAEDVRREDDENIFAEVFVSEDVAEEEPVVPINAQGQKLLDIATKLHKQREISDEMYSYLKDAAAGRAEWNLTGDKEAYIEKALQSLKRRFPNVA